MIMKANLWKPSGMFLPGIIPVPPLAKTSVAVEALYLVRQAWAEKFSVSCCVIFSVSFPLLYKIFVLTKIYEASLCHFLGLLAQTWRPLLKC